MARFKFGLNLTDWVFQEGSSGEAILAGGVEVTFWNSKTGGVRYTDLLLGELPTSSITSSDGTTTPTGTIPEFSGPDGITSMWADAGGGTRYLMITNDLADLPARVTNLENSVATLQNLLAYAIMALKYDPGSGSYPEIPAELASQRYLFWIGPTPPEDARTADIHVDTVE